MRFVLAALTLCLLAGLIWAGLLWRGPGPMAEGPEDRAVPIEIPATGPVRLTVFGTSLSSPRYDWPEAVAAALSDCLGREVPLARVTRPGANVIWATGQVGAVLETVPDLVLVEFAINDADLRDGVTLARARDLLAGVVADLAAAPEPPATLLMTMSPARGLRGLLRPRLGAHYAATRAVAAEAGPGLIDLEARWRDLPRNARGLDGDGLHPDAEIARGLIVPVVVDQLARAAGVATGCAAPS